MTIEAKLLGRFTQLGIIARSMRIVASETRNTTAIHQALYKIVALHPVLVRRAVGVIEEILPAELRFIEPPEIAKIRGCGHVETDRPVVVTSLDRILQRLSGAANPARKTAATPSFVNAGWKPLRRSGARGEG